MPAHPILLLEADPAVAERVGSTLTGAGYEVTTSADPTAAVGLAAGRSLVIVGSLEQPDAAEMVCRHLRATSDVARIPILCFIEGNDVEDRVRLLEAGADDVLTRSFDARELDARVQALLIRYERSTGFVPHVAQPRAVRPHQVTVCSSAKGGVGTTLIAVNVAVILAERLPGQVALVDLATPIGQVATHLNILPRVTVTDLARDEQTLADPAALHATADKADERLDVFCLPVHPGDADRLTIEQTRAFVTAAREAYPHVIIDAGSNVTSRTLALLSDADRIVLPTSAEIASLRAVTALMLMLAEHEIAQRSLLVVNHLYAREMVRPSDIEEALGVRIAVELPYDALVYIKSVNEGIPLVRSAPRTAAAEELGRLASLVAGEEIPEPDAPQKRGGLFAGLRRRG